MIKLNTLDQQNKDFKDSDTVCFCFKYTKADIEKDYLDHGRSTIMERITLEKKNNGCNCSSKNPKGI